MEDFALVEEAGGAAGCVDSDVESFGVVLEVVFDLVGCGVEFVDRQTGAVGDAVAPPVVGV